MKTTVATVHENMLVIKVALFFILFQISNAEELRRFSEKSSCSEDEFFNANLLQCVKCNRQINLVPSFDGLSCVCSKESIIISSVGGEFPRCQLCSADQEPNFDQKECIPCASLSTSIDNANNSVVECGSCSNGGVSVGQDWSGETLMNSTCVTCTMGYIPRISRTSIGVCEACQLRAPPDLSQNCSCPSAANELITPPGEPPLCVPRSSLVMWPVGDKASSIDYESVDDIVSQLIKNKLRSSVLLCQLGNRTACQCLANLCALSLYQDDISQDGIRPTACKVFRDIRRIPPAGAVVPGVDSRPWLFYGEGDAPSVLARRKLSTVKFSLNPASNLSIIFLRAAQFDMSGHFVDLIGGGANILSLCAYDKEEKGLRFGARYRISCEIHAKRLIKQRLLLQDLYLQIPTTDGSQRLYALPVLVRNMPTNQGSDPSTWQLVRRIFLVDNQLGKYEGDNMPKVIRYLQSCQIRVRVLGKEGPGQILPPLVEVRYGEITAAQLERNEAVTVSLAVDWEMEHTSIYSIQVAAGVLGGLGAAWAGVAAWSQSRRDGRAQGSSLDLATLARVLVLACGPIANALLLVAGCSALLTLLLYKGQTQPHTLLPTSTHEILLRDLVISAAALKIVEVLRLLWCQLQVDLFFMDWERPRTMPQQAPDSKQYPPPPVSIWRCYLVANEWNEIQATRRTSVAVQLLLTVFFLQVVGMEHWASPDPELHLSEQPNSGDSKSLVLRLAVGLTVYIAIYLIQWLLVTGFYERYIENNIQQFIDLCSVANISVFVLANENYGYYLHGRSAHGSADTDMRTLGEQLRREQEDLCAHRGLVPGCEQQTFEMALPPKLRAFCKRITAPLTAASSQPTRRLISGSKNGIVWQGNEERVAQAYDSMNRFLATFFQHAIRDLDYEVKEKAFLEKILDIELADVTEKAILFTDDGHSFDRVLFYGHEFTLFTFDVSLFCCAEMLTGNFLLATIITALANKVLVCVRQFGGRRNVARKTLVDERFLI